MDDSILEMKILKNYFLLLAVDYINPTGDDVASIIFFQTMISVLHSLMRSVRNMLLVADASFLVYYISTK